MQLPEKRLGANALRENVKQQGSHCDQSQMRKKRMKRDRDIHANKNEK